MKRHLFTIVHFFILILFLIGNFIRFWVIFYSLLLLIVFLPSLKKVQIDTKGGRGGGGGGRGRSSGGFRTGSRASSSGGSFAKSSNRYRSYPSYSSYNTRMNRLLKLKNKKKIYTVKLTVFYIFHKLVFFRQWNISLQHNV